MDRAEPRLDALRRLAAEVRADLTDMDRLTSEAESARLALSGRTPSTLEVYGAGKIVHDLYTCIERSFVRVATILGGVPEGTAWHRTLLDDMALDIRGVRPPVITIRNRDALAPFLRFRHLFRNIYAFTLDAERLSALLGDARPMWQSVRADVEAFVAFLDGIDTDRGGERR